MDYNKEIIKKLDENNKLLRKLIEATKNPKQPDNLALIIDHEIENVIKRAVCNEDEEPAQERRFIFR